MAPNARTGLDELSEDRCWELLGQKTVGRLAVTIAGHPDIFPVNYRIDHETIVVKTAAGLKLAAAVLGDSVAFEVDALDENAHTGWSVVLHGTAAEIEGTEELMEAEELGVKPWADSEKTRYFRVTPTSVTGRAVPST